MLTLLMASLALSSVSTQPVLAENVWIPCSLNTKTNVRTWAQGERTISLGMSISFKPFPDSQLEHGVNALKDALPGECLVPKHQLEDLGVSSQKFPQQMEGEKIVFLIL